MEWMSPMDSSFLHIENDTTPMHIGGVSIFEGPPPPFEELRAMVAGKLDAGAALPPEGPLRAARRRAADLGRRPALQPRLPPAPHRDPGARQRAAAAPDGQPRVLAGARSRQAAVGAVDGRGHARRPLGAALEGPPLHGRRRRRDRPDVGDVLRRHGRPPGRSVQPWAARAGALRTRRARAHARSAARARPASSKRSNGRCARRAKRCASIAEIARAAAAAGPSLRPVAASSLTGPIGPHRRWSWAHVRLADVKTRARGARRHGQRRRADGHHQRLPRAAASRAASHVPRTA